MDNRVADIVLRIRRRPREERTTLGCRRSARALARELHFLSPLVGVEIARQLVRADERQFAYELIQTTRGAIRGAPPYRCRSHGGDWTGGASSTISRPTSPGRPGVRGA